MRKRIIILALLLPLMLGFSIKGHYWVTNQAFEELPEIMGAFKEEFHNPVLNSIPPYYMLPDLTEPGHANEILARNAENHYKLLVQYLEETNWFRAKQEIGYLAHYSGDAASPTQHNPACWGKIDDAYDFMVDHFLNEIQPEAIGDPDKIADIYQFYLERCHQANTLSDQLIQFYNETSSDSALWAQSKPIFQQQLNYAVSDLRNVLYTAWDAAGQPASYPWGSGCVVLPTLFEH